MGEQNNLLFGVILFWSFQYGVYKLGEMVGYVEESGNGYTKGYNKGYNDGVSDCIEFYNIFKDIPIPLNVDINLHKKIYNDQIDFVFANNKYLNYDNKKSIRKIFNDTLE